MLKYMSILLLLCSCVPNPTKTQGGEKMNDQNKDICSLPVSDEELKKRLSPEQYRIVRQNGTEAAFKNAYWDNHKDGIYVDIVSGDALFASVHKFDSGTGWPSFTMPITPDSVKSVSDDSYGMRRIEVRSLEADSHLGHVFDDGPSSTGLRFCINSASLRFVPMESMAEKGYGDFLYLFPKYIVEKLGLDSITLAAGCFWGVEEYFRRLNGVVYARSGYAGGTAVLPTYEQVCTGKTGHAESVWIAYDPKVVSLETLLDHFFDLHDPTSLNRQGNDIGSQYRSGIFTSSKQQREQIDRYIESLKSSGKYTKPIVTEIREDAIFYSAETYHQRYLQKNPGGYCHIDLTKASKQILK